MSDTPFWLHRRLPVLVVTLVGLAALVVVGRSTPASTTATFTVVGVDWMPAAPEPGGLTSTWFCPGVPATGEEGVGGEVVVSNRRDEPVRGQVTLLSDGEPVIQAIEVGAHDRTVIDVDAEVTAPYVSAVVEIEGGGGLVEQRAFHPAGNAVSPCANSTSATWYLADGFTLEGSRNQVILSNPYDDDAIVDIGFATAEGSRTPNRFQGFPVRARSVQVIDFGAEGGGARNEELLAVRIETTRGRVVAGRAQRFLAGGRLGFTMNLAAPALADQWWFAEGEKGPGVTERFSIYNPGDDDTEVDVVFLGISTLVEDTIVVPARQVVAFQPGTLTELPDGRHATVFASQRSGVVVERALTRSGAESTHTSVSLGAPPRLDGYVATQWRLAIGPDDPVADALVVYNVDASPGAISVFVDSPDGPVPVAGLENLEIAAGAIRTVPLEVPEVLGRELVITSSARIFVERSLPSGVGAGRSTSWALPAV